MRQQRTPQGRYALSESWEKVVELILKGQARNAYYEIPNKAALANLLLVREQAPVCFREQLAEPS